MLQIDRNHLIISVCLGVWAMIATSLLISNYRLQKFNEAKAYIHGMESMTVKYACIQHEQGGFPFIFDGKKYFVAEKKGRVFVEKQ